MKRLYVAGDLVEAHIVLHQLDHAGVVARVLNASAAGGLGDIPFTHTYPEIWIERDVDFDRGRAVVAHYEASRMQSGTRRCPGCGEENPATFELCWSCGTALTGAGR